MTVDDPGLVWFNALPDDAARPALQPCCAAPGWLAAVAAGRPYPDRPALLDASERALAGLDWAGVRAAIDVHPRIGERAAGAGREASWSAAEQSGMDGASADVKAALVRANQAYEERFGHVFLIFATGRSDLDMLTAASARVHHDDETERAVVRGELGQIVALRLTRLLDGAA